MPLPRGHVAAAATRAAIKNLTPRLAAFLECPFDGIAIRDWYLGLATHCPLWSLQERAYLALAKSDENKLVLDHAWQLMVGAAETTAANRTAIQRGVPVLESRLVGERSEWTVHPPPFDDTAESQGEYLVRAYRATLLRRRNEIPLEDVLARSYLHIPELVRTVPNMDPDDPPAMPDEAYAAMEVVADLRRLVVARDLASGEVRAKASQAVKQYLRELGVQPSQKGGRPSLPNAKKVVAALARECAIWLPVEARCRHRPVSDEACKSLRLWRCEHEPEVWAARLAFPFLAQKELEFVRSVRDEGTRHRDRDLVTAVHLIHNRVDSFLNPTTTADYALGTFRAQLLRQFLDRNPLRS